jgi:O-antigen ligase
VVVIVPLVTREPTAFTNRGYIWGASLLAWRSEPWFGFGSRYFTDLARTSGELGGTVYHGHNELVQLLVVGGMVLVALVGLLLLTAIVMATRRSSRSMFWFATLFVLAGVSLLETSLSFVENTFLLSVLVLPLASLMFGPDLDADPRGSRDVDLPHLLAK